MLSSKDIEGRTSSQVIEYVYKGWPLEEAKEDDKAFAFVDIPRTLSRKCIRVALCVIT